MSTDLMSWCREQTWWPLVEPALLKGCFVSVHSVTSPPGSTMDGNGVAVLELRHGLLHVVQCKRAGEWHVAAMLPRALWDRMQREVEKLVTITGHGWNAPDGEA